MEKVLNEQPKLSDRGSKFLQELLSDDIGEAVADAIHTILNEKFKVINTNTKKKVATNIKPIRYTTYDKDDNVIQERNVVYGTWEPLVDEETWWKAQEILKTRSEEYNITKNGKTIRQNWGRRQSVDACANKGYP